MGITDYLGLGKTIAEPIKAVGDLYTTDKARLQAEAQLQEAMQPAIEGQQKINAILAGSGNWFNSSWQPLLGWSAGFLILLYYAPQIVITTWVWGTACFASGIVAAYPMKPDDILNLVYLLLGFGTYSLFRR